MTTEQMKYFIETARCLSFTEAADRLFLSQSALSRQIAALEGELNAQLFLRSRNTVRLTPAGQVLLEGVTGLYSGWLELREAVDRANAGLRGILRLGLLEEQLLPGVVRRALRAFAGAHPEV